MLALASQDASRENRVPQEVTIGTWEALGGPESGEESP